MRPAREFSRSTFALLLVCLAILRAAGGNPYLENLLSRIDAVPDDATAQAHSAALKAYDGLLYSLRTAPDGLVNTATRNARFASETRNAIEALTQNTRAVRPGDLSACAGALRSCIDSLRAAALETVSIVEAIRVARLSAPELQPVKRGEPFSAATLEAISSAKLVAAESGKLSDSVMVWSAAMEKASRQAGQLAAAISSGRFRELAAGITQFRQASEDLKRTLHQINVQADATKEAVDMGRHRLSIAGPYRPESVIEVENRLTRSADAVDKVSGSLGTFSLSCRQCGNAVALYTNADVRLWANSPSSFLDGLPAHLKRAIDDIDEAVARAHSLSGAVKTSVDSSLSAAQKRAAAPDSGMQAAVRGRSQDLLRMLRSRADRMWELDIASLAAEVDSLVALASKQAAIAAQGVVEVASPQRAEAEKQLSELAAVVRQTTQLYQQLTIHANGPGMVQRPGCALAAISTPPPSSSQTPTIDADAVAGASARDLQARLQPVLRELSDHVARERSRRGIK